MMEVAQAEEPIREKRRGPSLPFLLIMGFLALAVVGVVAAQKIAYMIYREDARQPLEHLERVRAIPVSEATLPLYLQECAHLERAMQEFQELHPPGSLESTFDSHSSICNAATLYLGAAQNFKLYMMGYVSSPDTAEDMLEAGSRRLYQARKAWREWR